MKSVSPYEAIYRESGVYFQNDPLPQLLRALHRMNSIGDCLDIGCGEGRDSLLMASRGHRILSVDASENGLARLQRVATAEGFSISVEQIDVREADFGRERFDLIYARTVLDHISKEESELVAKKMCDSLKPQGQLVVEVFSATDPGNCLGGLPASDLAGLVQHYFTAKELFEMFPMFHLLSLDRCFRHDDTHGTPHFHETLILCAVKNLTVWPLSNLLEHV